MKTPRTWLRIARINSEWPTKPALAKQIGVAPLAVHSWEDGSKMPSWENRRKLALLFGDNILTKFHDEERAELAAARRAA